MSGKWQCPVCRAVVRCPPRRGATLIAAIAHHEALCTGVAAPDTRRHIVRVLLVAVGLAFAHARARGRRRLPGWRGAAARRRDPARRPAAAPHLSVHAGGLS